MGTFDAAKKLKEKNNEQNTEQNNEHKNVTEHEQDTEKKKKTSLEDVNKQFDGSKTKEEEYTRQTYLIRNDLIKKFDKVAKKKKRGYKTGVINALLEDFLEGEE